MKRIIYEINYSEQGKSSEEIVNNDSISYHKIYVNPYKFYGMCGQRCDTIYCDSRFMDSYSGRELIDTIFKPMLCWKHPEGEGFKLFNP